MNHVNSLSWTSQAPLVIAHRGASAFAPENTLSAFTLAVKQGADAIELDAKLTADGRVVVYHDLTLDRTTSGKGKLAEKSLAELKRLDAGSFMGQEFRGERIPTLDEVFETVGDTLLINVELTNYGSVLDRLVPTVVEMIQRYKLEESVLLSSFSPLALLQVRHSAPNFRTGLLLQPGSPGFLRALLAIFVPHQDLHPHESMVDEDLILAQHAAGRRVNAWTVDDRQRIEELIRLGVDGIITNDPAAARDVVTKVESEHG